MASSNNAPMMEDYHQWSSTQAAVVDAVTYLLLDAVKQTKIYDLSNPFVIVDYGTANGWNSRHCFRECIQRLRDLYGDGMPILLCYNDQPATDFRQLFTQKQNILGKDLGLAKFQNVFCMANGNSFFQQCFPDKYVNLGLCTSAVHNLSKIPCLIGDANLIHLSKNEDALASFKKQAADDWLAFLVARQQEMKPGSTMVVTVVGHGDPALASPEIGNLKLVGMMETLHKIWQNLLLEEHITHDEYKSVCLPYYYRVQDEISLPFSDGSVPLLQLDSVEPRFISDPLLAKLKPNIERGEPAAIRKYAEHLSKHLQVAVETSLLQCLGTRTESEKQFIVDTLFAQFEDKVKQLPLTFEFSCCMAVLLITKKTNIDDLKDNMKN